MNEKPHLTKLVDIDRDIVPNAVTAIYAGTGAGKNSIIEGYHKDDEDYTGLMERFRVLLITSRKSKVLETIERDANDRNLMIRKVYDMGDYRWDDRDDKSVICTNAHIAKMIRNCWDFPAEPFWEKFDYIVIDEFHSIFTDATFAESAPAIKQFLDMLYERYIKGKPIDEVKPKLVLMSATPEPAAKLLTNYSDRILDKRDEAIFIKPDRIRFTYAKTSQRRMAEMLKNGKTVIYYMCRFDNMETLIQLALNAGLPQSSIAVSVSAEDRNKSLEDRYKTIFKNKERAEAAICEDGHLPPDIRLFITNSKNKEGINIKTVPDLLVIEDHCVTDIIQICGRMRNGVPLAEIICDANQHQLYDSFKGERQFYENTIAVYNAHLKKLIQENKLDPEAENCYLCKDVQEFVEAVEAPTKYVIFNPFTSAFEMNTCYIEAKQSLHLHQKTMDIFFDNLRENNTDGIVTLNGYFKDIPIEYEVVTDKHKWLSDYMAEHEWVIGETVFEKSAASQLLDDLNAFYNEHPDTETKKYKDLGSLLHWFGCCKKDVGKHDLGRFMICERPAKNTAA